MSKESKNIHAARQYYIKISSKSPFNSFGDFLNHVRQNIPNIRLNEYKYLTGVLRIYIEETFISSNELDNYYFCRLNTILRLIYDLNLINYFDRNLNLFSIYDVEEEIINFSYSLNSKYKNYIPKNYYVFKFCDSSEIESFLDNFKQLTYYIEGLEKHSYHLKEYKNCFKFCIIKNQDMFDKYSNYGCFYLLINKNTFDNDVLDYKGYNSILHSLFWIGYDLKNDKIISITDRDNFGIYRALSYKLTLSKLENILKCNVYKMIHNF